MPDDKDNIEKAVALKYDKNRDPSPKMVAKGQGTLAEQIINLANENGIPIERDPDLVEMLSVLEVDEFIPVEAYVAVAEILAYIYRKNNDHLSKE